MTKEQTVLKDIGEINPLEREIEVTNPENGEVMLYVTIMSPDDKRMTFAKRRIQDRQLTLHRRGKTFKPEEIEENEINLLSAAITGWRWGDGYGFEGGQPDYSPAVAQRLLKKSFIRNQIDEQVADTESFFQH
jgi:hypothetical protein